MSEQPAAAVRWPPGLKACLKTHLAEQRDGRGCWKNTAAPCIDAILAAALEHLQRLHLATLDPAAQQRDETLDEYALAFIADCFDTTCFCSSLLSEGERAAFPAPPKSYAPAVVTGLPHSAAAASPVPAASKAPKKRGRAAEDEDVEDPAPGVMLKELCGKRHFVKSLPVEYLLRFLATLPSLLSHFTLMHSSAPHAASASSPTASGAGGRSFGESSAAGQDFLRAPDLSWFLQRLQTLLLFLEKNVETWKSPTAKYKTLAK